MKRIAIRLLLPILLLAGCSSAAESPAVEDSFQEETVPATASVTTLPTSETETIQPVSVEEEMTSAADEATDPTEPPATEPEPTAQKPKENPKSTESIIETKPISTEPPATEPKETEPEVEPTEQLPTQTEPSNTEPVETPTEPTTTESTECAHDWTCIHHEEEGHWKAGIVCDCGWTAYGEASTLVSLWAAHVASYPPEEAFFEHGGYGSVDEWIVDTPAYNEWVCRYCGEQKP